MTVFEYIKTHLPILDVVQDYVTVKPMGNYHKGPCPFHNETDASFTVSPDKGIYYCFGCHAGGDVVSFVAKSENLQPYEAVEHLVERYGIKVPSELLERNKNASVNKERKNDFFSMCEAVAEYAHEQFLKDKDARAYIASRHVDDKMIDSFRIGYLKGGMRPMNLFTKAMAHKSILVKDLVEAGILAQGRSMLYSPFEERILFPITDSLGRNCGFGGRIFKPADQRAKYYNSKESDFFSKGKVLFGLNGAKKTMQKKGRAFLVEGYTDCVSMVQAGYTETIATLGTACTLDHLKLLSRYITTLYVVYDGDAAGRKAIMRLTSLCWDVSLSLRVLQLPHNHDPASFLQNGGDLEKLLAESLDIFSFFVASVSDDFHTKTLAEKLQLTDKIIEVVANISDSFKQDLLLQEAAVVMQLPFDSLKKVLQKKRGKFKRTASDSQAAEPASSTAAPERQSSSLEEKISAYIFNSVATENDVSIAQDLLQCFSPDLRALLCIAETIKNSGDSPKRFQAFLARLEQHQQDFVVQLSMKHQGLRHEQFVHLIALYRKQNWKLLVQNLKTCIVQAKKANDVDKVMRLMADFVELKKGIQDKGLV